MSALTIATFNVENLFGRAKVINYQDHTMGDAAMARVAAFEAELSKATYDKAKLWSLWSEGGVSRLVDLRENREKFFRYKGLKKTGVKANGRRDWDGWISFKRGSLKDVTRKNTAKVIKSIKADIICLVEVESRPVLEKFNALVSWTEAGSKIRYPYNILIDGNDPRGIDVALLSRYPLGEMKTNIFTPSPGGKSELFSRDCLEVTVDHPDGFPICFLLNHFKSKGYSKSQSKSDERRKTQAQGVRNILDTRYDLASEYVVVCGDLNDTPDSDPLSPLFGAPDLHDALAEIIPDPDERWTYHYKGNQQIDYLLVSTPLKEGLIEAGVERRGVYDVERYSGGAIRSFPDVTTPTTAASDHGAVWAAFDLP